MRSRDQDGWVPSLFARHRIIAEKGTYLERGDGSIFCRLCWATFIPSPIPGDPKGIYQHEAEAAHRTAALYTHEKRRRP